MLSEDLLKLLNDWEVDDEYIENFERERIRKVSTLRLLTEKSLERLFPEEGPRLEFREHLSKFKDAASKTADNAVNATSSIEAAVNTAQVISYAVDNGVDIIYSQFPSAQPSVSEPHIQNPNKRGRENNEITSPSLQDPDTPQGGSELQTSETCKKARSDATTDGSKLRALCESKVEGRIVLAHYSEFKELDERNRNLLADICIRNFVHGDPARILRTVDEESICNEILALFPNEMKEIWLGSVSVTREHSAGRGKLLNRYYSLRRTMAKVKLITPSSHSPQPVRSSIVLDDIDEANQEEINDNLQWLQNSKRPWPTVMEYWKKTTKARQAALMKDGTSVHSYMNSYPAFKEPEGFLLLDADFSVLYKGAEMRLFSEWQYLSSFIMSKLSPAEKEEIESALTSDSKKLKTLLALCKLFPVITAVKAKNKNQWRPSRQEAREGLVHVVKTNGDLKTALDDRREKYEKFGLTLGPQVVAVGADEDSIVETYVMINTLIYEVENPLKGIDIVFKAMHALDTPYHAECRREWLFLQIAIYGISTSHDKKALDVKTSALINEFKKFKSD